MKLCSRSPPKKKKVNAAGTSQSWTVVKESKWKHILIELLTVEGKHCSLLFGMAGWWICRLVTHAVFELWECQLHLRNPEYLSWHPVSATMGFQWCWPKTIITSKRPEETRFKPPFHSSGTILHDKACAFAPGGCQSSFFHWYSFVLLLYARYGNFHLWWLLGMF